MSSPNVSSNQVAMDMMRRGKFFSARDLMDIYSVPGSRAHSIVNNIVSSTAYEIERLDARPLQIKIYAVNGERANGPRWFEVLLYSKWPVAQRAAA